MKKVLLFVSLLLILNGCSILSELTAFSKYDDMQVAQGLINQRIEIAPMGRVGMIRVKVHADLMDYLEGDSPGYFNISHEFSSGN